MRLSGKEFEKHLVQVNERYRLNGDASVGRYGVEGSFFDGTWTPQESKPDFEGVRNGRQIIFDAKVCSQASFSLAKYRKVAGSRGSKRRQLDHMFERSEFGSTCFFLIHWNERVLTKKIVPVQTWLFPVSLDVPFWARFERIEETKISLADCENVGVEIAWESVGGRKPRPNWLPAVAAIMEGSYV